jgi:hypothetical protein
MIDRRGGAGRRRFGQIPRRAEGDGAPDGAAAIRVRTFRPGPGGWRAARAFRRSIAAFFDPGPRFRDAFWYIPSASSWRGDRSVPQAEPRYARWESDELSEQGRIPFRYRTSSGQRPSMNGMERRVNINRIIVKRQEEYFYDSDSSRSLRHGRACLGHPRL